MSFIDFSCMILLAQNFPLNPSCIPLTESPIRNKLIGLLAELRGFKFVTTLIVGFKKIESDNAAKYTTFYSNSKAETIIYESKIDDVFESIYTAVISNIKKYLRKGPCYIIDSVVNHSINISKYNLTVISNY